ncbi:hypothetical protein FOCG_06668 [Fusarium oxysporum f. sp. radicis-lycopersici 26381]|nr:hypothetical protein FOZG_03726 [Fusarium oxysporum Fo47]EWZ93057.1 hypothetical protein FOWG_05965 [Fusarium oxysporum f. sp. lycopersici MN25]EXL53339.1 hypothetical protein FOCG_06668 [Fusarium oxysporum f. sp. radicis-lycopersici 26381]
MRSAQRSLATAGGSIWGVFSGVRSSVGVISRYVTLEVESVGNTSRLRRIFTPKHSLSHSALFNFQSLLLVLLLLICTSAYVHHFTPGIMDRNKNGFMGIFWKCARIGERLSPYISICCVLMAVSILLN